MIRLYKLLPDGRRQIIGFALLPGTGGIKVTSPPTRSDRVLFASSPSPRLRDLVKTSRTCCAGSMNWRFEN